MSSRRTGSASPPRSRSASCAARATLRLPPTFTSMTSARSAAAELHGLADAQDTGGADDVVEAAEAGGRGGDVAPRRPDSRARRDRSDVRRPRRPRHPRPPAPRSPGRSRSCRRRRRPAAPRRERVGFGSAAADRVRIWIMRSARTMSVRVVILRFTSSPGTATMRAPGTWRRTRLQSSVALRSPTAAASR